MGWQISFLSLLFHLLLLSHQIKHVNSRGVFCNFSNLLGSNLDELFDELYTFAELAAEEYLGGNPKLDLIAPLKQKAEILSVFSTALSAEREVYQLLLEDIDNIIRDIKTI